jgi:Flp pilus assembly protein TadG
MLIAIRSLLTRKIPLASRLRKNEDGAAAVEFALVALPFFGLIFAVIEIGIFFFASRYLEDGVFNAGRKALTQRLNASASCTDFVDTIKSNVGTMLDPAKLVVNVSVLSSFSSTSPNLNMSDAACSMGASNSTILIQVSYPYPFTGFRFLSGGASIGSNLQLNAATVLRVE